MFKSLYGVFVVYIQAPWVSFGPAAGVERELLVSYANSEPSSCNFAKK